ncbi:MAG: glycosyltransferase family 39 protein, partial [Sulfurifustaceae bacterium]
EPLLLALVLALWFGYELGSRALWTPDEGRYAEIPREMLASGDFLTPRLNGVKYFEKPPLVYWLEAGAIKLFGVNEWALRIWPALFGLLGCLVVYYTARRLYDRRAALFSAGLLAISPLYDFMGGILTLDMPLTGFLTGALCAFLLGIRAPPGGERRALLYGFYVCIALAVMTKGLVGLALPGMIIGAWMVLVGRWRVLREIHLVHGIVIFLAIAAPWHVLVARANPEFLYFYFVHEHLQRYLTTVHNRYEPAWFFVPVLLVGFYPWTVFLPYTLRDALRDLWAHGRERDDVCLLLLWASLPFLFFSLSDSKLIPYVLPIWPPLALLVGRWLEKVWEGQVPVARVAYWLSLALGVAFALVLLLGAPISSPGVARILQQLGAGRYAMAGALLAAGALPFVAWRFGNPRLAVGALFLGGALLVGTFDLNSSRLDVGRSVKELALVLKRRLKADDEVINYATYYQDLPVYLGRRITVVNWKGELEFGMSVEDTREWMVEFAEFRRRWNAPRTEYLLTSRANYDKLRADPPGPMHLLAQTEYAVLVTNREAAP